MAEANNPEIDSNMKKLIMLAIALASVTAVNAQKISANVSKATERIEKLLEKIELTPCIDPEYDWQQYDEKNGKAKMEKKFLLLESKKDDAFCGTFCELPIAMKHDDFIVRLQMAAKISDDKGVGIIFDVEDDANYRMLLLMKKSYQLINIKDGKQLVAKKGVFKIKTNEIVDLAISRYKEKLHFLLNGQEFFVTKSPEMENPTFGFVAPPKTKIACMGIGYWKENPADTEEEN